MEPSVQCAEGQAEDEGDNNHPSGEGSSGSDWEGEPWEDIEQKAMRALDEKLDELYPATPYLRASNSTAAALGSTTHNGRCAVVKDACIGGPSELAACLNGGPPAAASGVTKPELSSSPLVPGVAGSVGQGTRQLEEACLLEPYRPEDHILTAEEMWGGLEDDEDDDELYQPAPSSPAASFRTTAPALSAGGGSAVAEKAHCVGSSPPVAAQGCLTIAANGTATMGPYEPLSTLCEGRPMGGLQDACLLEPYRPEDHVLTADEMWGGREHDNDNVDDGLIVKEAATLVVTTADSSRSPTHDGSKQRLCRILAGGNAPALLEHLDFDELSALADDCTCAAETLRWVLQRQRDLVAGAGRSIPTQGGGVPPGGATPT